MDENTGLRTFVITLDNRPCEITIATDLQDSTGGGLYVAIRIDGMTIGITPEKWTQLRGLIDAMITRCLERPIVFKMGPKED